MYGPSHYVSSSSHKAVVTSSGHTAVCVSRKYMIGLHGALPCRRVPGVCLPVKFRKIDPSVLQVHCILKVALLQSKEIHV